MATIPFGSIDSIWRTFDLVFTPSGNYDCFIIGADCTNPSIGLDAVFVDDVFLCVDTLNIIDPDLGEDEFVCANDSIELNPEMPGYDHLWNTGETTESIYVSETGSYYVTVTDPATGCSASDTAVVTEVQVADETDIQTACDAYTWIDGNTYTESNNTATYTETSVVGCDSVIYTLNLIINGPSCFSIPGGLSPNGDQVNDTWQVNGLDAFVNVKISIFDRWGQKIYFSSNPMQAWDGTYNGRDLPIADYYYILELGNGETYNGVVTLKR
jgi:gliding motility-associated-like protein